MSPAQRNMPRPKPETLCGITSAAKAAGVAPMKELATAYTIIAPTKSSWRPASSNVKHYISTATVNIPRLFPRSLGMLQQLFNDPLPSLSTQDSVLTALGSHSSTKSLMGNDTSKRCSWLQPHRPSRIVRGRLMCTGYLAIISCYIPSLVSGY